MPAIFDYAHHTHQCGVRLLFSVWLFIASNVTAYPQVPIGVPPTPTPSAQRPQSTSTTVSFEECQMMIYTGQQSDTLLQVHPNGHVDPFPTTFTPVRSPTTSTSGG